MSKSKEALGDWITKYKGNLLEPEQHQEEPKEAVLYDLVAMDTISRAVLAVLVWKNITGIERANRLIAREQKLFTPEDNMQIVAVVSGTAWRGKVI